MDEKEERRGAENSQSNRPIARGPQTEQRCIWPMERSWGPRGTGIKRAERALTDPQGSKGDHAQNGQPGKWPSAVLPRAIARASVMAWQGQRSALRLRVPPSRPPERVLRAPAMRRAVRVVRVRGISAFDVL
jgi:hypothetical protein